MQKRAILAMLGMIESGLRELRTLLAYDDDGGRPELIPQAPEVNGYLDEDEEKLIERRMEEDRQKMIADQKLMQDFWTEGHS